MNTSSSVLTNYTEAIESLPDEAFLGSLLYFTIANADVNLAEAREELIAQGLSVDTLRKNLRPVDAFNKTAREFAHKFRPRDGIRSEFLVRAVGTDGEQVHRHIILERAVVEAGKKRRIAYDKVGELIFTRGTVKKGEYSGYLVDSRQTTSTLGMPMNEDEEGWLVSRLETLQSRFDHLVHYMDSHAVRSFVRGYIYNLGGVCVRESGGIYFIGQEHHEEVALLNNWVRAIGSTFHALPLLNVGEQREMILEALEEDVVGEVSKLMGQVSDILKDPDRKIEQKTYDAHRAYVKDLSEKVEEYNEMLSARAERAALEIEIYSKQTLALSSRIKQSAMRVNR